MFRYDATARKFIHNATARKFADACGGSEVGDPCDTCGENDTPQYWTITINWGSFCSTISGGCGSGWDFPSTTTINVAQLEDPTPGRACRYLGCQKLISWDVPNSSDPILYGIGDEVNLCPGDSTVRDLYIGVSLQFTPSSFGVPGQWIAQVNYPAPRYTADVWDPGSGQYCCNVTYGGFTAAGVLTIDGTECTIPSTSSQIIPDTQCYDSKVLYREVTSVTITPGRTGAPDPCFDDQYDPDDDPFQPPPDETCCKVCQPLELDVTIDSGTGAIDSSVCVDPVQPTPMRAKVQFCGAFFDSIGFPGWSFWRCFAPDVDPDDVLLDIYEFGEEFTCSSGEPACDDPGYVIQPPSVVHLIKTGPCTWTTDPAYHGDNSDLNVVVTVGVTREDGLGGTVDWHKFISVEYGYAALSDGGAMSPCTEAGCNLFSGVHHYFAGDSLGLAICATDKFVTSDYARSDINPFKILAEHCLCDAFVTARVEWEHDE